MKFVLEIKMDNAAFHDPFDEGEEGVGASGGEVARILREVAGRVDQGDLKDRDSGILVDYNGNRVGSWSVTS